MAQPSLLDEETARAQRLLHSTQWREKAWGVHLAGRLRLSALHDLLVQELQTAQAFLHTRHASEGTSYIQSLFDALIDMDGKVPAQVLLPFAKRWNAEVIILLARDKGNNEEALLTLREEKLDINAWLAVNNLLLSIKSARLFRMLLEELTIVHQFVVPDGEPFREYGGNEKACGGGGSYSLARDFPPTAVYRLEVGLWLGSTVLIGGPRNISYRRLLVPTNRPLLWNSTTGCSEERQHELLEYVAHAGFIPLYRAKELFRSSTILDRGITQDFSSQIALQLEKQAEAIQDFIKTAEMIGQQNGTSNLRLRIQPQIIGQLHGKDTALPSSLTPREIVIP